MVQGRKVMVWKWFGKKNVAPERAKRRRQILGKAGSIQGREESEHPQMSLQYSVGWCGQEWRWPGVFPESPEKRIGGD